MANFLELTLPSHSAQTSKITGGNLSDLKYSKLGATPVASRAVKIASGVGTAYMRLTQENLKAIEADWKEVSLDFTQLGLTVVGLIEVAEPVQIGADLSNGAIDISRGHPIIGAISMFSAVPIAGLVGGIPLAVIRAFKCVWNGLKFLGKSFIVFAVKPGLAAMKFIWTHKGVLLNYSSKLKRFVENSAEKAIEGLPKITENMMKQLKSFGEKLAKEPSVPVSKSNPPKVGNMPSLEEAITGNMKNSKATPRPTVRNYYYPESLNSMLYKLGTKTGKPGI